RERARQARMELARDGVEDAARIGEAHLGLLRMDVHVDEVRRDLDPDDADRIPSSVEHRAIRVRDRAREQAIAYVTSVDEEREAGRSRARALGRTEHRFDAQRTALGLDLRKRLARQRGAGAI